MVRLKRQWIEALMADIQSFNQNISMEEVEMILSSQVIEFETLTKRSPEPEVEFQALMERINRIN